MWQVSESEEGCSDSNLHVRCRYLPLMSEDPADNERSALLWGGIGMDELVLVDLDVNVGLTFMSKRTLSCNLRSMILEGKPDEVAVELDGTFKLTRRPA